MLLKVQPGYTLSNLCLLIYPIALNCTLCCTFATALLAKFRFAIYLQCNTVLKCNLCEYLFDTLHCYVRRCVQCFSRTNLNYRRVCLEMTLKKQILNATVCRWLAFI